MIAQINTAEEYRKSLILYVLSLFPPELRGEINRLNVTSSGEFSELSEIRLRVGSGSSVMLRGEWRHLHFCPKKEEIRQIFSSATLGEMYLHTENILSGYISPKAGLRIGIVGTARYESERLAGIDTIMGLVFRFPYIDIKIGNELSAIIYEENRLRSALLFSPPGGGKSTALRSLALSLSRLRYMRIIVVDERREFVPEMYSGTSVDILSGFKKSHGVELATRVLTPEIIMIDEIANDNEAEALRFALGAGVPVVATIHAGSVKEIMSKRAIAALIRDGLFDTVIGISCESRMYKADKKELAML